jgi:hypothetical protein
MSFLSFLSKKMKTNFCSFYAHGKTKRERAKRITEEEEEEEQ